MAGSRTRSFINSACCVQVETQLAAAQRQAEAESSARGHSLMMADEVVPLASLGGYHRFASSRRFGSAVKVRPLSCHPLPPLLCSVLCPLSKAVHAAQPGVTTLARCLRRAGDSCMRCRRLGARSTG